MVSTGILTGTSNEKEAYFIGFSVAMNVKADAYVAVFGLAQQGANAVVSNCKINAQITAFMRKKYE